jgi:hypothetical protein
VVFSGAKALIHFGLLRGAEAPLFHGATGFSGGKTMKVKVYTRFSGKRGTMEISMGGRDAAGRGGRRPGERDNTKHRRVMAEMQFMLDATPRLWRVQVKASGASHHKGFAVRACWRTSTRHVPYTREQIDFLAVVIHGERVRGRRIWYVIPVRALGGRLTINLYPFGSRKGSEERFEKCRGAWGPLVVQ